LPYYYIKGCGFCQAFFKIIYEKSAYNYFIFSVGFLLYYALFQKPLSENRLQLYACLYFWKRPGLKNPPSDSWRGIRLTEISAFRLVLKSFSACFIHYFFVEAFPNRSDAQIHRNPYC